jgi:hypothetical protein
MPYFKDVNGRDWQIRLTGPALQRVREATGIRLADPSGQGTLEAVADGEILTRVLWLLCSDQQPPLTPEQFAEAVASGEVFERARAALQDSVVDFTPPSQRPALLKALETEEAVQTAAMALAIERLDGDALKDQLVDALRVGMDQNIATILTQLRSAGGSPGLPGSTPTPQPSES